MSFRQAIRSAATAQMPMSLHGLLDERALLAPDALGFRFLTDGEQSEELLTYGELARRARTLAAGLVRHGAVGQPVLLIHPPGLGFIEGLFACWHAGAIAVPAYPPRGSRHRRRLEAIRLDSGAKLALAPAGQSPITGATVLESESLLERSIPMAGSAVDSALPCLLQYTSGSTAEPKGVMISHANFRSHFSSLGCYAQLELKSALSWLPPYHDMGLVLKILYAFEAGIPLTFLSPDHFIQRPVRWLRAISRYRAELSGAPNFAFEMCLRSIRDEELEGLNLSCWKAAPCGAERVRPETLERFAKRFANHGFRPEAFLPGYGLAETTLIVTASPPGAPPAISEHPLAGKLVSSGVPLLGSKIRIVAPDSGSNCAEREIGEIRVKGAVVSKGYWNRAEATLEAFGPVSNGELCTGDLGYFENGQLYVTGRIKDLIIIDGTNFSPDDIESAAFSAAPEVTAAAAFSMETAGRESAVLALEAGSLPADQYPGLCRKVRDAISDTLEFPLRRVVIVRSGLLPRTTSGKIRRSACRELLEQGALKLLFDDEAVSAPAGTRGETLAMLLDAVAEVSGRSGASADDDLIGLGMSSIEATRLAAMLHARTGTMIPLGDLFSARSFREIGGMLSGRNPSISFLPEIIPGCGSDANILTHSQERMWFLHQLDPESAAYHIFGSLELTGPLDAPDMCRAIGAVISRHEILCSRHGTESGRPKVWIDRNGQLPVARWAVADEAGLQESLTRFSRRPFNLATDSAVRVCLVSCGPERHILAVCAHHIVADGWSMRILAREIAEAYAQFRKGENLASRPPVPSYLDYAASHRRWIDSGAVDSQVEYWKSKLAGHPGVLQLATDFPRPPVSSSDGGALEINLTATLCNRVAALARARRVTPFMVHLTAFLLLLRQHGAGNDPVVAVPVANRNHAAAAELIGTLVNTLPFRLTIDPAESFANLLERVRLATFEMQASQDAPFEKIIEAVKPGRSRDHAPLAQVMFDYQEIPIAETWAGGLDCRPFIAHRGSVQFDLSLLLTVLSDRQQLTIEYRSELFLPETAAAMLARYVETLEQACGEPNLTVTEINGLTHLDKVRLSQISMGPRRPDFPLQTTPALISRRAVIQPHRLAVDSDRGAIDYATLESRSTRLAGALRARGVGPGDRVAILVERDANLPIALLAAWKAGAAYVPLDGANPPERLKRILDDQAPIKTLVSPELLDCLPPDAATILLDGQLMSESTTSTPHPTSPSDPAYVIYTSGSTGIPKGVVISHGALANFLLSMAENPGFGESDRLLAVTTISFDISALEIFLPLIVGGTVDVASTAVARDGAALLEKLKSTRPTVMQATPATWRMLVEAGWSGSPALKILCGGEALDLPLAVQLGPMGRELWNLYGPTETTVWSTVWRVPEQPKSIRIGSPIANTGIHILGSDGTEQPPGVTGELWISGSGLANGYWKQPELTARHFVSERYHTGDLARWHADGTLECLGRSDSQVKIRGFRVELGEIEAALAAHPAVGQAKVAFRGAEQPSKKLIAWITSNSPDAPPDVGELRNFLAARLPAYMLPAEIGVIDAFPLNSNGKVDVSTLGIPAPPPLAEGQMTPTERKLAAVWAELLERPVVVPDDDWFHVGGHSLLALRLFARIHQDFHRRLPLSAILDHSTLRALASAIDETAVEPLP
jgi:amino acid adenylation domain-containing protein